MLKGSGVSTMDRLLYKGRGKKSDCGNYRMISILSILGKNKGNI